jgi:hypothetical protein
MRTTLLRLAAVLPLLGILMPMVSGLFVPGYSSIAQHMSELESMGGTSELMTRVGGFVSGLSIIGFAVAIMLGPTKLPFTAFAAAIFGVSMVANGYFTYGSPLHGLYGVGIFIVLVPSFFAAETRMRDTVSLATGAITLAYMWLMPFEPHATHGLTQRIAAIIMFGWFSYASRKLLASQTSAVRAPTGALA